MMADSELKSLIADQACDEFDFDDVEELEIVEDTIPLYNIQTRVKVDRESSRVYLVPQKEKLDLTFKEGYVMFNVPKVQGHQMIIMKT